MAEARRGHTATLLLDGRVLVAGGYHGLIEKDPDEALATVELYDPATGTWTAGPPMPGGRTFHRAIRLGDGRVLVVGGATMPWSAHFAMRGDAAIFDPAAQTWSVVNGPLAGRTDSPILLPDGRVVITGAWEGFHGSPPDEMDILDPASGTWTMLASGKDLRGKPLALLPDGSLLMIPAPTWQALTGTDGGRFVTSNQAWRYDPVADSWTPLAPSPIGFDVLAASPTNGRVLLVGDKLSVFFDPATGAWDQEDTPPYISLLTNAVTLSDGRVLFAGATDCVGGILPAQILVPEEMVTDYAWGLPDPVGSTFTTLDDGRVLAAGGGPTCPDSTESRGQTSDAYLLDPAMFLRFVPA